MGLIHTFKLIYLRLVTFIILYMFFFPLSRLYLAAGSQHIKSWQNLKFNALHIAVNDAIFETFFECIIFWNSLFFYRYYIYVYIYNHFLVTIFRVQFLLFLFLGIAFVHRYTNLVSFHKLCWIFILEAKSIAYWKIEYAWRHRNCIVIITLLYIIN